MLTLGIAKRSNTRTVIDAVLILCPVVKRTADTALSFKIKLMVYRPLPDSQTSQVFFHVVYKRFICPLRFCFFYF